MRHQVQAASTVALVLAVSACGSPTGPSQSLRLADARARWDAAAISSYEVELIRGCYCGWPDAGHRVTLRVVGTAITHAWYTDSAIPIEGDARESLPTVPALFAMVAAAISGKAHDLQVTYDPTHGAPTTISIDYVGNAMDDEVGITVFRLRWGFIID